MLLISVYSKSVSLCILAYYNEIRKRGRPCGRKSLHFKRRVVEVYRAEIAQPADIDRYLHIPLTELRRLNRWYFKHQLAPYLYPYRCYKSMKKHDQDAYVKTLERRLAATEEENKLLKLKAEAYQTAIQIAE